VLDASGKGFEYSIVAHTAAAAASPVPMDLSLGDLRETAAGSSLRLTDASGGLVAQIRQPMMTDAGTTTLTGHHRHLLDLAVAAKTGGHYALALQPDLSYLNDPSTVYPVTLDPAVGYGYGSTSDTMIDSANPNTNYGSASELLISGSYSELARDFLSINVDNITGIGAHVNTAYVNFDDDYAPQCTPSSDPINVFRVNSPWSAGTLTWNNGQLPTTLIGSSTETHGGPGCAPGYFGWYVAPTVQAWLDKTQPNYGFAFAANHELDNNGIREYRATEASSGQPYLYVDYTSRPVTAPAPVSLYTGNGNLTVQWNYPSNDGGSGVTAYNVYVNDETNPSSSTNTMYSYQSGTSSSLLPAVNGDAYYALVLSCNAYGCGPGAASATSTPGTVPAAPGWTGAAPCNTCISASWTTPYNGGNPITGYTVRAFDSSNGNSLATFTYGAVNSARVGPLTNGHAYYFTIAAQNARGTGPYSGGTAILTAQGIPTAVYGRDGQPTTLPAVSSGDSTVTVSWTQGDMSGGTLSQYAALLYPVGGQWPANATAYCYPGTASTVTFGPGALPSNCTGTPPVDGTSYNVEVFEQNHSSDGATTNGRFEGAGFGPPVTSLSVIPAGVPFGVGNVQVSADESRVDVSWSAPPAQASGVPGNNGSTLVSYSLQAAPSNGGAAITNVVPAAGPLAGTIDGLKDGIAYQVSVSATNSVGTGPSVTYNATVAPARVGAAVANPLAATISALAPVAFGTLPDTGLDPTTQPVYTPFALPEHDTAINATPPTPLELGAATSGQQQVAHSGPDQTPQSNSVDGMLQRNYTAPPDPNGAVGPNYAAEVVNASMAVYTKDSPAQLVHRATLQSLFGVPSGDFLFGN